MARAVRAADALVVRALTRVANGDLAGGIATWRRAIEAGAAPELVARARPILARVEGRGATDGGPPPPPPDEPASAAWAAAWAGDLDAAPRPPAGGPPGPP